MFITFESTSDGLGKTTQAKLLVDNLNAKGINAIYTREPGGTEVGLKLREIILNVESKLSERAELLMFMADRAEHVEKVIKPALKEGIVVVCDRYFDSTIAYQGFGRGVDLELLFNLHKISTDNLIPNLTFIMDGTPFKELEQDDTFESLGNTFMHRVKAGIMSVMKSNRERCAYINANNPIERVQEDIMSWTMWALNKN